MTYEQVMVELFEFSSPTLYKWKKHEKRKVFTLLDKYFSKDELEEFLTTGKVSKYEALNPNSDLSMLHNELASIKKEISDLKRVIQEHK